MWKTAILFLATLAALSKANDVLHEKRGSTPLGLWRRSERVQADTILPLRIGLKQYNLEVGAEKLIAISHPDSEDYGKHLSVEEVHELFAPSQRTVETVRDWLIGHGIPESLIAQSDNKGWIAVNLPAREVESLLSSEVYEFEHSNTGSVRLGCDQYHIPAHLVEHIDYITPGVKMSAIVKKRDVERSRDRKHPESPSHTRHTWNHDYWPKPPGAGQLPPDVKDCTANMTPPCWRYLYNLPVNSIKDSVNDAGVYEQGDYFSQSDISKYFAKYSPRVPSHTKPRVLGIDGGQAPVPADDPGNTSESDIDIDIIISLIYPQSLVVYQVDDAVYAPKEVVKDNTFNTFLDSLEGSYCNYTAYGITGNSPGIDPVYPDRAANGYKGGLQCGIYKPTRVISISYGESERDFPKNYVLRQCNEFMKLGLMGHTILSASGDFGVGGYPGNPTVSGCLSEHGQNETIYNADYPSGCPWLTSVGATRIYDNQTVKDRESALQANIYKPGRAMAYKLFASGGGFSNYFSTPDYQKSAHDHYLKKYNPGHPSYVVNDKATNIGLNGGVYNRAGRGFPDVSANGALMPIYINGTVHHYYGTSLSAPIWASVITLVNQQRTILGKGPVGFINPALYTHPYVLNDIVNGSNPNCGTSGFQAQPGWDPVTGLGTPNYPKSTYARGHKSIQLSEALADFAPSYSSG